MTPSWKTAMLLLMVLYPMVMLQSKFVAPVIGKLGAQPWLSVWLSQVVSVALMQWWLMPTVSSWCRRWLDPVDGAGLRISLRGAAVAVIVYAASLTVFATVEGCSTGINVAAKEKGTRGGVRRHPRPFIDRWTASARRLSKSKKALNSQCWPYGHCIECTTGPRKDRLRRLGHGLRRRRGAWPP